MNYCVVDTMCDACALSAMEDVIETCGRDEGDGRVACLDVIATMRPDLMGFDRDSPTHPGEAAYDLYVGWTLESKTPTLLRWLLQRKPGTCRLANRVMAEIVADTDYVDRDAEARPNVRGCLEVLSDFMHVPMTKTALDTAAACGNAPFFEWVFDNKPDYLWKRREITDAAFSMGHLHLVRRLIQRGVPFDPRDAEVIRGPFETKKQYRKRKLFVAIIKSQSRSD